MKARYKTLGSAVAAALADLNAIHNIVAFEGCEIMQYSLICYQ